MDNILANNNFELDDFNPLDLMRKIAANLKQKRLFLNFTREDLASKSGVSLGTLKRFEDKAEISLKHLLMLAIVLNAVEEFKLLFQNNINSSIDKVLKSKKIRKRGRKND
ncbi:MAG: helix-turn-helix transcriptional regulator [Bacteroidota bacterium]